MLLKKIRHDDGNYQGQMKTRATIETEMKWTATTARCFWIQLQRICNKQILFIEFQVIF